MHSNSKGHTDVKARGGGRAVPVTRTRARARFPLTDWVTYVYAVAALAATALVEDGAGSLLTYLHLH